MTLMATGSRLQIPVIYDADVLVFGATSGAVAAALDASESGRSVVAVSDRSYFGEETAGTLELWPTVRSEDPLYKAVYAADRETVSPGHIKHVLESALLARRIPFLYECRPVFVLYGDNGKITGVVLAARTALYAVTCQVVVDASHTGLVARLAGLPLSAAACVPGAGRDLVVIAHRAPEGDACGWEAIGSPFVYKRANQEKPQSLSAYRLHLPGSGAPRTGTAQLAADHLDRARLHYHGVVYSADAFTDVLAERLDNNGVHCSDPNALPDSAFLYCGGRLLIMNGLLPLTSQGAEALNQTAVQLDLGRRVGRMAAACAAEQPRITGAFVASAGQEGVAGEFGFAAPFLRRQENGAPLLDVSLPKVPVLAACDVLVAGGGTSGAPAGVAAAQAGARTIVLERLHNLGGLSTLGLVSSYYMGNRVGFTLDLDAEVNLPGAGGDRKQSRHWNPEEKAGWYLRALASAGGAAWLNSFAFGVERQNAEVTGVLVSTPYGVGLVQAKTVIDASGNADLAAAAGAPCREIDHRHVAVQGTGLSPRRPGLLHNNSDHTFIDDNDPVGVTHAYVNARAKFKADFDVIPMVASRERRQIVGDIELSPLDFLAGRTYNDTIVTASSNFDSHGFTVHPVFMVQPPDKTELKAHMPFRCMLPQGLSNLLVTGLGISAHRDAIPVVRMQADLQNQGYAAGLAAAMAAQTGCGMRDLPMRKLQQELVARGCLEPAVLTHEDSFPLPEQTVRDVARRGPVDVYSAAVIFGHLDICLPILLEQLQAADEPQKREDAALILGLCGRGEGVDVLVAAVEGRDWDEGWNYRGMSQFGFSMSRLDALIVALGKTGSPKAVAPVLRKIRALDENSAFSHCRAVSVAASALAGAALAEALYELLMKPGMQGHAQLDTATVIKTANAELNETAARNASLKELILGRGLYLCGDCRGLGRRILETYSRDLRGHFARHAQAVLSCTDLENLRREVW